MLHVQCHMYNVHVHCHIYNVCMCMEDRVRDREIVRGGERSARESATLLWNTLYCSVFENECEGGAREGSAKERKNTLQHTALQRRARACSLFLYAFCNPCNALQHIQHTATHCNTLQHTATHCNTLRARGAQERSAERQIARTARVHERERERERERETKP